MRILQFGALYPLTFKTTISLLFPITKTNLQQQNVALWWAIAIMALELFNKAISWNT